MNRIFAWVLAFALIGPALADGVSVPGVPSIGVSGAAFSYPPQSGGGGYVGPLDIQSGATFCVSLRACSAALAAAHTSIADIVDTSTGAATCTITSDSNGDADLSSLSCIGATVSVTTFCTVTHPAGCSIAKLYDQTGNIAAGASNGTLASMPTLVLSATSTSKPAMALVVSSSQLLTITLGVAISQPFTYSAVSKRSTSFTSQMGVVGSGNAFIGYAASASSYIIYAGSVLSASGVDNAFVAAQGVANGASSSIKVNGNSVTTGAGGSGNSGTGISLGWDGFSNYLTGNICEGIMWPSAVSSGNQSSLATNQQSYWGT
jgi:hypothetical protein